MFLIVPSNNSIPISSSVQIKLEPQITTDDPAQHADVSINGYDLAEKDLFNLSDITQLTNGPEQIISSEMLHHNLDIIHNNESTFDTL